MQALPKRILHRSVKCTTFKTSGFLRTFRRSCWLTSIAAIWMKFPQELKPFAGFARRLWRSQRSRASRARRSDHGSRSALIECPEWKLAHAMADDLIRAGVINASHTKTLTGNQIGELHMSSHGKVRGVRHIDEVLKSIGLL